MDKLKKTISASVDLLFGISFLLGAISFFGYLFDTSGEVWKTMTLSSFFYESRLMFCVWIFSLFYVPIRLLLQGKFWGIIFGETQED